MSDDKDQGHPAATTPSTAADAGPPAKERREGDAAAAEIGGPQGPEPTRFGDWERKGRCIDF